MLSFPSPRFSFHLDDDPTAMLKAASDRLTRELPMTSTMMQWNASLEFLLVGLGLLGSFLLFCYYLYFHRTHKVGKYPSRWTTDQINACIIPLAIAVFFALAYYMSKFH